MARRRRRGLTPEDRALWEAVAASATPLHKPAGLRATRPAAGPRRPRRPAPRPDARRRPLAAAAARHARPRPDPHAAFDRAHPHMDRRRFEKLRRGRLDPEARIDLHGMTSERAHGALTGFILDAHAADLRLVLVITGKGRPDEPALEPRRHGILRHSLPHWLAAPPLARPHPPGRARPPAPRRRRRLLRLPPPPAPLDTREAAGEGRARKEPPLEHARRRDRRAQRGHPRMGERPPRAARRGERLGLRLGLHARRRRLGGASPAATAAGASSTTTSTASSRRRAPSTSTSAATVPAWRRRSRRPAPRTPC